MKTTEWKIYQSRRLWALIAANQLGIFALFYWLFGKFAFFLIGPFTLYNLIIYLFPFWYQFFFSGPLNKGLKFQQLLKTAKTIFPHHLKLDIRFLENDFSNLLILAHKNHVWIFTSEMFMDQFTPLETELLIKEIEGLHASGRLKASTLISAIQWTLPLGIWRHNRGSELIFFSQNTDLNLQRLNFKVLHWCEGKNTSLRSALIPCLMYPALTSYNQVSYFSLYNFLREKLITSLKAEETAYGK